MKNILDTLFLANYEWNTLIVKNKDYPEFASAVQTAFFLTLLSEILFDLLFYFITGKFNATLLSMGSYIYMVVTVNLLFCLWYSNRNRATLFERSIQISSKKWRNKKIAIYALEIMMVIYLVAVIYINKD